jgi:hypothetical protein
MFAEIGSAFLFYDFESLPLNSTDDAIHTRTLVE